MGMFSDFKARFNGILAKSMINGLKSLGVPLINQSNYINFGTQDYEKPPSVNYASLWAFFKSSPEAIAVVTAIAEDVISDGWYLEGGKNNKARGEDYLLESNAKQEFFSWVMDALVTGDGYVYKAKVRKEDIDSVISNASQRLPFETKSINNVYNEIFEDKAFKEEIFRPKWFKYIASSTLAANYDEYGNVKEWVQRVGTQKREFRPDEIVRYPYMRINGEFYGFTPMQSILTELNILKNIKNLSNSYFIRGGLQNIFILEEETPDSANYKLFCSQIEQASMNPQKFKNLIVTGKVTREEINPLNKDMEYRQLAKYITDVIITSWGVPSSRLSDVLSEKGKSQGGINTEGYYRKISHMQDILEETINKELLEGYNVKLRFNRAYKQDEVREATIQKVLTDVAQQRLNMGIVKPEYVHEFLRIPDEYRKLPEVTNVFNQGTTRNVPYNDLMKDPAKMAADENRRNSANRNRE